MSVPSGVVGWRVQLVHTSDPYTTLKPGDIGTIDFVDSTGTVFVRWDNGSRLGMVKGSGDLFTVLDAADAESVVCERCGERYDEERGDGYCGLCPSCADATEPNCVECDVCDKLHDHESFDYCGECGNCKEHCTCPADMEHRT